MTSYDEIWLSFLNNCKMNKNEIPTTPEMIYECIQNAVSHFNNRLRTKVSCNHQNESVDSVLSEDELLILSHMIKLILIKNELVYQSTLLQPFQKDIGIKNYNVQINALREQVKEVEKDVERLIFNADEEDYGYV
ncbi:hypothetical protein [Priestia flexa]|uniref:hypothetical protein n=1 Tax=Priestia flexa TaxID=86664 RepID=UPI000473AAFC|nr:hypothetical protein [Priestia flexa]